MTSGTDPVRTARRLHQEGNLQAALELCETVLSVDAQNFDAWYLAGLIAVQVHQPETAVERFDRALAVAPENAAAHCNRAVALQGLSRWDAALAGYDSAIRIKPDYALALNNRGNVLVQLQRREDALASYDQAILTEPDFASAHFNRANLLQSMQAFDAAIQGYDKALILDPRYAEAHANRGAALSALNRLPDALASFDAALALRPQSAEAHFGKAITLLLSGELLAGWAEYEWRPQTTRYDAKPRWGGTESLAGKRLLVHCERGLGDTLQYCRYVKALSEMRATVILQVQEPLVGVLQHLAGAARVMGPDEPLPEYDFHCPLLSLPLAFRTTLDSISAPQRYLEADPDRIADWRNQLAATRGPRMGLVWRGDPGNRDDIKRSMPLSRALQMLPVQLHYVSLQKDISAAERATLNAHPRVSILRDELDFPDTAAVCECLDLVISVDTSVAHLSAALGKRTWILLPFNPDCRWLLERTDSPWYPSVRLYRQPKMNDWQPVLRHLAADLRRDFIEQPLRLL